MASHPSILAWKITWTNEPGGLQSMVSQRVVHHWTTESTHTPLILCEENGTWPLWSSSKIPSLQLNHGKTDTSQLRDTLWNILPVFIKIFKVIKNKESLRNCHSQEEPKDIWLLNVMWHRAWNPGTEEHRIKTKENWMK